MEKLFGLIGTAIQSRTTHADYNFSRKVFYAWAVVLILLTQSLLAGGTIKGVIVDNQTGDALPGANIVVKGTSIGASTDLDGVYLIPNVPAGEQTLEVSYIGYKTVTAAVNVPDGGTARQDFKLQGVAVEGEEVVVTTQALGQKQAINQQLTANTIVNIVSSEKIQELPDESAAAALSRLPGVSLQDGDKVVIRGLQAKMNTVLVNGIALPSTDMDDRSTNLGFISSNMLSGIEVTKVLTPDMDANTIGGVVDLRIKEAPVGFQFDVLSQGMFNTQDRTSDNYKVWGSLSNRFLGDKLGVFIQGNADRTNGGLDQTNAGYIISDNNMPYGYSPYFMNSFVFSDEENIITNYGGSIILDYKLPSGKIVMQNTLAHTINDNAKHRTLYSFINPIDVNYSLNRDKHNKELVINALQGEYNFGPVKMEIGLAHSYSDKNTDIRYGDPGTNLGFRNKTPGVPHFLTQNGDTLTANDFQRDDRLALKTQDVYNMVVPEDDWQNAVMSDWNVTRSEAFKQHLYNTNLDFTVPTSFSDFVSGHFKFGGKFTRSTRTNDANETYHRVGDSDYYLSVTDFVPGKYLFALAGNPNGLLTVADIKNYDYNRGKYYLNGDREYNNAFDIDMMDRFMVQVQDGWNHVPAHAANSARDDFNGTENFTAGYLMGDFNIGPKLSFIGGARYEHYNMDYKANFVYVTHAVDGDCALYDTLNTVNRSDDNFFPNAQLRYKYANWGDVRIAYTNSIIRPDYRAIMPNTFYVPGSGSRNGNTLLKPTISYNYDTYFSFYNNEIGLFTIGGFYKKMNDVFFQSDIYFQNLGLYNVSFPDSNAWKALGFSNPDSWPSSSDVITTFLNNPNPAYVKGLELEWQTHFWYLPNPLNGLVLNANYTRVWSKIDYRQIDNWQETIRYQDEHGVWRQRIVYHSTDTVRTERLFNQGDHIVNVALGIDYRGFSGRLSFNMQSNVISYIGARPEADQYTGNIYRWDFTLQQKLPIPGLSMALNGINIFHNVKYEYQKFPNTVGGSINENLFRTTYSPRKFELALRYTL
jgi:TonB-dependent receptor